MLDVEKEMRFSFFRLLYNYLDPTLLPISLDPRSTLNVGRDGLSRDPLKRDPKIATNFATTKKKNP